MEGLYFVLGVVGLALCLGNLKYLFDSSSNSDFEPSTIQMLIHWVTLAIGFAALVAGTAVVFGLAFSSP